MIVEVIGVVDGRSMLFRRRVFWALMIAAGLSLIMGVRPAGAICAAQTETQAFRHAEVVFEGVMLEGPTVNVGDRGEVLLGDAPVRVERYLKGGGPQQVDVTTGLRADEVPAEDPDDATGPVPEPVGFVSTGIAPSPGERWVIYGAWSDGGSVTTSTCSGSHRFGEAGPFVEPGVVDVIRDQQLLWGVAVSGVAAAAVVVHRRSTRATVGR